MKQHAFGTQFKKFSCEATPLWGATLDDSVPILTKDDAPDEVQTTPTTDQFDPKTRRIRMIPTCDVVPFRHRFVTTAWLLLLLFAPLKALAQQPFKLMAPTNSRGHLAPGKFQETVNLLSGSVNISIPMAKLSFDNGFEFGLTLFYDSSVWSHFNISGENSTRISDIRANPFDVFVDFQDAEINDEALAFDWNVGPGWLLDAGRLLEVNPPQDGVHYIYRAPDHSKIPLYETRHGDEVSLPSHYYSRDGTNLKLIVESPGSLNGLLYSAKGDVTEFLNGHFASIQDPFGNRIDRIVQIGLPTEETIVIFRDNRHQREIRLGLEPTYIECGQLGQCLNPTMQQVRWVSYPAPGLNANDKPNRATITLDPIPGEISYPLPNIELPELCNPESALYDLDACLESILSDNELLLCNPNSPSYDPDACQLWRAETGNQSVWRRYQSEGGPFSLLGCLPLDCWGRLDDTTNDSWVLPLERVTLPDGTAFQFKYGIFSEVDGGPVGEHSGALKEMILASGGKITYTWGPYRVPDNQRLSDRLDDAYYGRHYWAPNMGVIRKTKFDLGGLDDDGNQIWNQIEEVRYRRGIVDSGNWNGQTNPYLSQNTVNNQSVDRDMFVIETSSLGDDTVHYFRQPAKAWDFGLPFIRFGTLQNAFPSRGVGDIRQAYLSQEVFEGPAIRANGAKGTLMRQLYVAYERDLKSADEDFTSPLNGRQFYTRTLYYDDLDQNDNPHYADTFSSDYDGYGHYRSRIKSGSWAGEKEIHTNYNPSSGSYVVFESNQGGDDENTFQAGVGHTYAEPQSSGGPSRLEPANWILNTYSSLVKIEDGQVSKRETYFNPFTGYLERERILANFGHDQAANDILTLKVFDERGGLTDTLTYGGDVQTDLGNGLPGDANDPVEIMDIVLTDLVPEYHEHTDYNYETLVFSSYAMEAGAVDPTVITLLEEVAKEKHTGLTLNEALTDGVKTSYTFDAMLREVRLKHDGYAAITTTYLPPNASRGHRIEVKQGTVERYAINDGFGVEIQTANQFPNRANMTAAESVAKVNLKYDKGVLIQTSNPFWPDDDNRGFIQFENHDFLKRVKRTVDPDGQVRRKEYQGDRLVRTFLKIGTQFNGAQDVSRVEIPNTKLFDLSGRLRQVTQTLNNASDVAITRYSYNVNDRLVGVTQEGGVGADQTRTFVVDNRGFILQEIHPENGVTTYSKYDTRGNNYEFQNSGSTHFLTYNAWGLLASISETDPADSTSTRPLIDYTYAVQNFQTANRNGGKLFQSRRFNYLPGETEPIVVTKTYYYESTVGGISTGKISSVRIRTNHGLAFEYGMTEDNKGATTQIAYPNLGISGIPLSLRNKLFGADSPSSIDFQYNRGFLQTIPGILSGNVQYHPHDKFYLSLTHANGYRDWVFQAANDMQRPVAMLTEEIINGAPNRDIWTSGTFQYDGVGNIVNLGSDRFRYDRSSRLVEAEMSGETRIYKYDRFGNLKRMGSRAWAIDSTKNHLAGPGVSYDNRGNLKEINNISYRYDSLDKVQRMFPSGQGGLAETYIYDSDNNRIATLLPDGSERWTIRQNDGRLLKNYQRRTARRKLVPSEELIYAGRLVAGIQYDDRGRFDTIHHYHPDHLGSIRKVTDSDGTVIESHDFWPFGEEITTPTTEDSILFAGHERDNEEQDYMLARYHLPLFGRFNAVDPVLGSPGDPQSWNRYTYARNNPLRYIDSDGQDAMEFWKKIDGFVPWPIIDPVREMTRLSEGKSIGDPQFIRIFTGGASFVLNTKLAMSGKLVQGFEGAATPYFNQLVGHLKVLPKFDALKAARLAGHAARGLHVVGAFTAGWDGGRAIDALVPVVGDTAALYLITPWYADAWQEIDFSDTTEEDKKAQELTKRRDLVNKLFTQKQEECDCSLNPTPELIDELIREHVIELLKIKLRERQEN